MVTKSYGDLERKIIEIFRDEGRFVFDDQEYEILTAGKPRPSHGECKTDVYVLGKTIDGIEIELKISVKMSGANEFQENKMDAARAEEYFGQDWAKIISDAARSIRDKFESRKLVFPTKKYPIKPDSITLGWKLEIASKPRDLSAKAPLSDAEVRDYVYRGTNQNEDKRDSYVGGERIAASGVADYLLVTSLNDIHTTADIVRQLRPIEVVELADTYLIFTANNYRTREDKSEGKRPLAVPIKWSVQNSTLTPKIVYDEPLKYTGGGDMKPLLLSALAELGKGHPSDFAVNDISAKYIAGSRN